MAVRFARVHVEYLPRRQNRGAGMTPCPRDEVFPLFVVARTTRVNVMNRRRRYSIVAASALVGVALALPAPSFAAGAALLTVSVQVAITCTVRTVATSGPVEGA